MEATINTLTAELFPDTDSLLELDALTLDPSEHEEPTDSDLSELEDLLTESLALQPARPSTRRFYKETKQKVEEMLEAQAKLEVWEVLGYAAVWVRTHCDCGRHGELTFVRNMMKSRRVNSSTLHWETIEGIPEGTEFRMGLTTTPVKACEYCRELDLGKFGDFAEIVK